MRYLPHLQKGLVLYRRVSAEARTTAGIRREDMLVATAAMLTTGFAIASEDGKQKVVPKDATDESFAEVWSEVCRGPTKHALGEFVRRGLGGSATVIDIVFKPQNQRTICDVIIPADQFMSFEK